MSSESRRLHGLHRGDCLRRVGDQHFHAAAATHCQVAHEMMTHDMRVHLASCNAPRGLHHFMLDAPAADGAPLLAVIGDCHARTHVARRRTARHYHRCQRDSPS